MKLNEKVIIQIYAKLTECTLDPVRSALVAGREHKGSLMQRKQIFYLPPK